MNEYFHLQMPNVSGCLMGEFEYGHLNNFIWV